MSYTYTNQKIYEGLECSICLEILDNPILEASCGQMFCQDCLKNVKKIKSICPLCNCKIVEGMVPKLITNILNEIMVFCNICNNGEPMKRSDYKLHLASGNCKTEICKQCNCRFNKSEYPEPHLGQHCIFSIIKCIGSKVNCPFESTREQVLNHQTTCSYISLESVLFDFINSNQKLHDQIIELQKQINQPQHKNQEKQHKYSQPLIELREQIKTLKQQQKKINEQKELQAIELGEKIKLLKQQKELQFVELHEQIKTLKKQHNQILQERNEQINEFKERVNIEIQQKEINFNKLQQIIEENQYKDNQIVELESKVSFLTQEIERLRNDRVQGTISSEISKLQKFGIISIVVLIVLLLILSTILVSIYLSFFKIYSVTTGSKIDILSGIVIFYFSIWWLWV